VQTHKIIIPDEMNKDGTWIYYDEGGCLRRRMKTSQSSLPSMEADKRLFELKARNYEGMDELQFTCNRGRACRSDVRW